MTLQAFLTTTIAQYEKEIIFDVKLGLSGTARMKQDMLVQLNVIQKKHAEEIKKPLNQCALHSWCARFDGHDGQCMTSVQVELRR
jgi:hypothetical protein